MDLQPIVRSRFLTRSISTKIYDTRSSGARRAFDCSWEPPRRPFLSLSNIMSNENHTDMALNSLPDGVIVSEAGFNGSIKLADSAWPSYYGSYAYRSDAIPDQSNQPQELNQTGLDRSASLRLPWGNTREVVPPTFMSDDPPKKLRRLEKKEDLADKLGLYVENSHECFRHAPLAFQARFFDMISVLGKVWAYIVSPIVLIVLILVSPLFGMRDETWPEFLHSLIPLEVTLLVGGWFLILIGGLAFRLFPKWLFRNGRGPEWEFNRRTGMIKAWQYSRKLPFVPRKPPVVIEKPFYEFDAWCCARVDRFGTGTSRYVIGFGPKFRKHAVRDNAGCTRYQ